jgi:hypothetical protein
MTYLCCLLGWIIHTNSTTLVNNENKNFSLFSLFLRQSQHEARVVALDDLHRRRPIQACAVPSRCVIKKQYEDLFMQCKVTHQSSPICSYVCRVFICATEQEENCYAMLSNYGDDGAERIKMQLLIVFLEANGLVDCMRCKLPFRSGAVSPTFLTVTAQLLSHRMSAVSRLLLSFYRRADGMCYKWNFNDKDFGLGKFSILSLSLWVWSFRQKESKPRSHRTSLEWERWKEMFCARRAKVERLVSQRLTAKQSTTQARLFPFLFGVRGITSLVIEEYRARSQSRSYVYKAETNTTPHTGRVEENIDFDFANGFFLSKRRRRTEKKLIILLSIRGEFFLLPSAE